MVLRAMWVVMFLVTILAMELSIKWAVGNGVWLVLTGSTVDDQFTKAWEECTKPGAAAVACD